MASVLFLRFDPLILFVVFVAVTSLILRALIDIDAITHFIINFFRR